MSVGGGAIVPTRVRVERAPPSPRVQGGEPAADRFGWVGHTLGAKYAIESVVGEGGFGVVYRARHLGFEEPVAVKCLKVPTGLEGRARDMFREQFLAEGRVLHQVSRATADVVQALDVGEATSPNGTWTPYLVIEWLEGSPLSHDLQVREQRGLGGRSLAAAIALLEPAARALAAAHEQGVAHLDVKPQNLFLAEVAGRPTLKVVDFGIARGLAGLDRASSVNTMSMNELLLAFTPRYGAPEQFSPRYGTMGTWTDVYALALVLVEVVTGEPALGVGDPGALYLRTSDLVSRPTLRAKGIDGVPDAAEMVLLRALAVDPRRRFEKAGAFWDALVAAVPEASERRRSILPAPSIIPATYEVATKKAHVKATRAAWRLRGERTFAATAVLLSLAACVYMWTTDKGEVPRSTTADSLAIDSAHTFASSKHTSATAKSGGLGVGDTTSASAPLPDAPAGMAYLAPGSFVMGSEKEGAHPVTLRHGFFLDLTEVTTREYASCVASGACSIARVRSGDATRDAVVNGWCNTSEQGRGAHPVNCVTAAQAEGYCVRAGKRLPTEAEWEWAARGSDSRSYPWGDAAPSTCAMAIVAGVSGPCAHKGTFDVGQSTKGKSGAGIFDMAGNVWEWVADGFAPYPANGEGTTDPFHAPAQGDDARGVVRGGSWDYSVAMAKSTARMPLARGLANVSTGFRCAKSVP